ncbi:MAG: ribonuclease III [Flavobacteriaceae bacterium]|jgi:ribonuclease-3|nr:ribonuclease III [Flavobacteriaceae bacterium]
MLFWEKIKKRLAKSNSKNLTQEESELNDFLTKILDFKPGNLEVYRKAFIHRSAQVKDENGNDVNFERLEFLGDAVLGLIIAVFIFEKAPDEQEGYLTKMRSKIVSRNQLNGIGKQMKLAERLHPAGNPNLGEDINGDLVEALIGAVYLDQGFETTANFIFTKIIDKHLDLEKLEKTISSYKSLILEWGQKTKNKISFNTFEEDNAEDLIVFVSVVRLNEKVVSKGRGTSKKRAEENAAKRAYYFLQNKMENVL